MDNVKDNYCLQMCKVNADGIKKSLPKYLMMLTEGSLLAQFN